MSATWSVLYVCACYCLHHLPATLPPRYSILAASFLSFFSIGMIFLLKSLLWSFVFYAIFGLALSLFWPVVMGWISSGLEGRQLSRVLGWFNFSWSMGAILSPVAAGWLEDMGNSFALRGGSLMFLAAMCLIAAGIFLMPELSRKTFIPPRQFAFGKKNENGTFLRYPAWFSVFASFFLVGTIVTVVSLAAGDELDITKKTVGILFMVRALTMSLILVVMGQTSWWHFRGNQMAVGALVGVFAAVSLAFTRSTVMMGLIMLVVGVVISQSYTNSIFHGVSGVTDKTWRMAIHEMTINAGLILGSVSGGLVYGAFGITTAYLISAAVMLISFFTVGVILILIRRKNLIHGAILS